MSTTTTPDTLKPYGAYVGLCLIAISAVMAIIMPWLPQANNSTFLLFVAQSLACVSGFVVLIQNIRGRARYATIASAILIMLFLIGCFVLALGTKTEASRLTGQEFGVVVSEIVFFLFASGLDDLVNTLNKRFHWVLLGSWLTNIAAMTVVVLVWANAHLLQSDDILTAAFLISYVSLGSTKYASLYLTSSHGSRAVRFALMPFILLPIPLGWVYLLALTHPGLLPSWTLNSCLFPLAVQFGVSYIADGILRKPDDEMGKKGKIPHEFWLTIGLQATFMVAVGIIGAFEGNQAPLIIGLLCMETLPNLPGGWAMFSEVRRKMHQQTSPALWYSAVYSGLLCVLIGFCALTIFFQGYSVLGAGITITLLQSVPWMQLAISYCLRWAKHPGRALFGVTSALIVATSICIFISFWSAQGAYSETDLTALWYSIARFPSAISLCTFALLGVVLVGPRAPRVWRWLLLTSAIAIAVGFSWFIVAFYRGGIGGAIAPSFLLQVAGGVNVALLYTAINSMRFKTMAAEELDRKSRSWGWRSDTSDQ